MKNPVSGVRFYNLKQSFGNNSEVLRSSAFIQVYKVQEGQRRRVPNNLCQ